jgi:NADH-quinone oxidoreductase subunit L
VLYWTAIFTAFLTALYTFRALCLTFYGEERIPDQAGHHAHESPPLMVAPLGVLAVCSIFVGLYFVALSGSWGGNLLTDFLQGSPALAAGAIAATKGPAEFHLVVAGTSTAAALAGIVLALYLYLGDAREASFLQRLFNLEGADRLTDPQWVVNLERVGWIGETTRDLRGIHLGWLVALVGYLLGAISLVLAIPLLVGQFISPYKLSKNKFYFDELYAALIVWPLSVLASICYWIDRWIVDGLVNATGWVPAVIGSLMRSLQMGLVQFYALAMVLGALVLVAARLIWAAG